MSMYFSGDSICGAQERMIDNVLAILDTVSSECGPHQKHLKRKMRHVMPRGKCYARLRRLQHASRGNQQ